MARTRGGGQMKLSVRRKRKKICRESNEDAGNADEVGTAIELLTNENVAGNESVVGEKVVENEDVGEHEDGEDARDVEDEVDQNQVDNEDAEEASDENLDDNEDDGDEIFFSGSNSEVELVENENAREEVPGVEEFMVEEEELDNETFENQFGANVVEEEDNDIVDDDDSGDDMFDDETIPAPLPNDEDEDRDEEGVDNVAGEILALGKTFNSPAEFKEALLKYSLTSQYDIKLYTSTSKRLSANCTKDACPWRVYCAYDKSTYKFVIRIYNAEHNCQRSGYTKMLKATSIANLFEERLRMNPDMRPTEIEAEIKREYNMMVSETQCQRAKWIAQDRRVALHKAQFARIWDYRDEIMRSNPGTTMIIEAIRGPTIRSPQRFDKLYICFDALKQSWKRCCRPIIGLDATFLKWDVKGQLLAAVGRDGDNRIFPIAWAVVEVEDKDNWMWFLSLLSEDLNLLDGRDFTMISDKHKGIIASVQELLPHAEHRFCARHVLQNWKKSHRDIELERLFWKVARSYTEVEYLDHLQNMKRYNKGAYESLLKQVPSSWSRPFFKRSSCCNDILNNLSESFNKTVREFRREPILDMLEAIRRRCMDRNYKRSLKTKRYATLYTPKVDGEIERNRQHVRDCFRTTSTQDLHEVRYRSNSFCVDMVAKTCGCGYWQLNGIPCMHVMCVITSLKLPLEDYVSSYYKTSKWQQLYAFGIRPVQGMKLWSRSGRLPILPPPSRFKSGRRNNYDRQEAADDGTLRVSRRRRRGKTYQTCSNCLREGHNRRKCPYPTVVLPPKRGKGRPKKQQEFGEFEFGSTSYTPMDSHYASASQP